jgi:tripartite-type tricarboxylate transporter receptor subunit TctC
MKANLKKSAGLIGAALAATLTTGAAFGQSADNFPGDKPITIVFATDGPGSVDTEYRLHIEALRQIPNTPQFIIEYKGGAGGAVGAQYAARANPDGHTLMGTASSYVTLPLVMKDAGYDANKSLAPVMLVTKRFFMILVHPSAPFKNLKDYIAYARSHPGELFWGSTGAGASTHMPGLLLHSMTNTKVSDVFYKQPAARLTDLIAGRINATAGTTLASMAHVRAGKLHPIAVTGDTRSQLMPDLPTVAESGIKGYEYSSWLGLLAPAKTPRSIISKVNGYFQQSSKSDLVIKKMKETDTAIIASTPEAFAKFLKEETSRLGKVIRQAKISGGAE